MIRKTIFKILYWVGISRLMKGRNSAKGRFPILVFHRVTPVPDPFWPPMTPATFEETIRLLKKHYTILPLEQLDQYNASQLKRACFLTFDDAFADTYQYAIPILRKHYVPASFFVPTKCVIENEVIWPLQLRNAFRFTTAKEVEWKEKMFTKRYPLASEKEKIAAYHASIDFLSSLDEPDFLRVKKQLHDQLGQFHDADINVMTIDQLKSISLDFGIHSHTHNHYLLTRLTERRMAEEFEESNRLLDHWGQLQTIKLLAFPVGSYSADVLKAAQPYFVYAFATGDRLADPSVIKSQGHSIPRFNIHHASPAEIFAFINGFHGMINRIFSGLR